MNIPKLVIFDMDGLIFDTERLFIEKQTPFLEKYGYIARDEDYIKTLGTNGEQLKKIHTEIYGPDYPTDLITKLTRAEVDKHMEVYGPTIKPGILELLEWLKQKNVSCAVASSTKTETVEKYLKLADIYKYFDYVIGGDQVSNTKPDPEIFLKAFERKHIDKNEALILEDSENGILAAQRAGIPVICIPDLKYPDENFREIPIYILSNGFEVINKLHEN